LAGVHLNPLRSIYLWEDFFMNVLNQNVLDERISYLKTIRYKNKIQDLKLEHCTDEDGEYIYLVCIKVKKSQQKKGYGNAVLDEIVQLADNHNVRIKLWVTDVFGTSLKVLYEYYKKHGFILIKTNNDGHMIYFPRKCNKTK
jgi:GNAT superfamily N-acetyltransferase